MLEDIAWPSRPSGRATAAAVVAELDLAGRTVLVTGANTGIGYSLDRNDNSLHSCITSSPLPGFETAKALAGRGAAVVMGCRSLDKSTKAKQRILSQFVTTFFTNQFIK